MVQRLRTLRRKWKRLVGVACVTAADQRYVSYPIPTAPAKSYNRDDFSAPFATLNGYYKSSQYENASILHRPPHPRNKLYLVSCLLYGRKIRLILCIVNSSTKVGRFVHSRLPIRYLGSVRVRCKPLESNFEGLMVGCTFGAIWTLFVKRERLLCIDS